MNIPLYTVQKCKKDNSLYGKIHYSSYAKVTFCGKHIDENWWILTNAFNGEADCVKCKKLSGPSLIKEKE